MQIIVSFAIVVVYTSDKLKKEVNSNNCFATTFIIVTKCKNKQNWIKINKNWKLRSKKRGSI